MAYFRMIDIAENIDAHLLVRYHADDRRTSCQASGVEIYHLAAIIVLKPTVPVGSPVRFRKCDRGIKLARRHDDLRPQDRLECSRLEKLLPVYRRVSTHEIYPFGYVVGCRPDGSCRGDRIGQRFRDHHDLSVDVVMGL